MLQRLRRVIQQTHKNAINHGRHLPHFVIDMVLKGFVSGPAQLAYNSLSKSSHDSEAYWGLEGSGGMGDLDGFG